MPSASLKNRIARLEASQGEADDDLYWSAVRDREPEFMDMFGKVIRHEISLETWHQWLAENPHPTRGRPPTPEEERQAEQAWSEFHEKLAQTRERLLRADEMGLFNNPEQAKERLSHGNTPDDAPRERRPPGTRIEHPEHPERRAPAHSPEDNRRRRCYEGNRRLSGG